NPCCHRGLRGTILAPDEALSLLIRCHGTPRRKGAGPCDDHEEAGTTDSVSALRRPKAPQAFNEANCGARKEGSEKPPADPVAQGTPGEEADALADDRQHGADRPGSDRHHRHGRVSRRATSVASTRRGSRRTAGGAAGATADDACASGLRREKDPSVEDDDGCGRHQNESACTDGGCEAIT